MPLTWHICKTFIRAIFFSNFFSSGFLPWLRKNSSHNDTFSLSFFLSLYKECLIIIIKSLIAVYPFKFSCSPRFWPEEIYSLQYDLFLPLTSLKLDFTMRRKPLLIIAITLWYHLHYIHHDIHVVFNNSLWDWKYLQMHVWSSGLLSSSYSCAPEIKATLTPIAISPMFNCSYYFILMIHSIWYPK